MYLGQVIGCLEDVSLGQALKRQSRLPSSNDAPKPCKVLSSGLSQSFRRFYKTGMTLLHGDDRKARGPQKLRARDVKDR